MEYFWYVPFEVHSVMLDVSFLSDSHMSDVLGKNLPLYLSRLFGLWGGYGTAKNTLIPS